MRQLPLALAALIASFAALAPAAFANQNFRTSWGGIEFAMSDRFLQASGDALALAVDPTGQNVAALGDGKFGRRFAYRFAPDGSQSARFRVGKAARVLAVGATGRVYTAGKGGAVTRWSPGGAREAGFATGAPVDALAVDSDGNVYVATGATVRRYDPDGAAGTSFGDAGEIGTAAGLAVDRAGHVFVADPGMQRIEEFGPGGGLAGTIGGPDPADGALVAPRLVGVDRAGHVFVGDLGGDTLGPPPNIKRYAADDAYEGPVDAGLTADFRAYGEPFLMAVAPQGDVYFADNPDFLKIPAALVAAPRMTFDDDSIEGGNEFSALPVSLGRSVNVPTRVFPSLARDVEERAVPGRGLQLGSGTPDVQPADVPDGEQKLDLGWTVEPTIAGRHVAQFNLSGTDPDGGPTSLSRTIAIYGIDGPRMRVVGAAWLPKARVIFLAVRLDLGDLRIAPGEQDVLEQISFGDLHASMRAGKRKLPQGDFQIGEVADGACLPFGVPEGIRGRRKFKVRAAYSGYGSVNGARRTKVVRPHVRLKKKSLLADCLVTSGFAGGPTG